MSIALKQVHITEKQDHQEFRLKTMLNFDEINKLRQTLNIFSFLSNKETEITIPREMLLNSFSQELSTDLFDLFLLNCGTNLLPCLFFINYSDFDLL